MKYLKTYLVAVAAVAALAAPHAYEGGPPGTAPGAPDPDTDGDSVPDSRDQCKFLAGNGVDGCPGPADVTAIVVSTSSVITMHGSRGQVIDCTNPATAWASACNVIAMRLQSSGLAYGNYRVGYEVRGGHPVPCGKREVFYGGSNKCEPVYGIDLQVDPFDYCKAAGWTAVKFTLNRERSGDNYWLLNVDCAHEQFTPEECRIQQQIAQTISGGGRE